MQVSEYNRLHEAEQTLWWFRAMRLFLGTLLPKSADPKVLDIGCGTGGFLRQLARWGYSPFGVDFSTTALRFALVEHAPILQASANELPFLSASFDLVTCVDVLEVATVNPVASVQSATRVLRPGGYALFVMAAHQWLLSEHDRAVSSVRRFNIRQLRELMQVNGLRVIRSTYLFSLLFPFVALYKLVNRPRSTGGSVSDIAVPPLILNQLLYSFCWLESRLLRFVNLPIGSSVLVLVQKNA